MVLRAVSDLLGHQKSLANAVVNVDCIQVASSASDTEYPWWHIVVVTICTSLLRREGHRIVLAVAMSRDFHSDECRRRLMSGEFLVLNEPSEGFVVRIIEEVDVLREHEFCRKHDFVKLTSKERKRAVALLEQ